MTDSDPDVLPADPSLEDERDLQHLQRMAMLGTLASGLGHDLRNLVMPVLLRLDALDAGGDLSPGQTRDLARIRQSMAHLQRLAGGLRLLASDPFDQRDEVQFTVLPEWWEDMAAVVHDALPPHAELEASFPPDLPAVAVPPAVLAQVLINLVMNARRAMDGTARPLLVLAAHQAGDEVHLEVADNGRGMDAETRRLCFEPYFTTRPREYATGLGLSTGRALMQRRGGDLRVGAATTAGATFTIVLPTRAAGAAARSLRREVRLLVREPRQLALVRLLVSQHGFRELAPTAHDAAELVICDAEFLPALLEPTGAATPRDGFSRIIAIGERPGVAYPPEVQWIDPGNLADLGALLA